ncbi:GNAT family N-acetyltransferase [Yokenella regensburgei]|uniref:GNAT family N-acetyltransferase n=1 Tax=Yokenella regensburgei TaxID=158877 RepID=UPI003F5CCEDA
MLEIRTYQERDFDDLCEIFLRAVTETASRDYSPRQIAAWAQIDASRWQEKLTHSTVRVAVSDHRPVGFITAIERYIDLLFVSPEFTHQGVASALLDALIVLLPDGMITVDASITAKPFFERYGFQVLQQQSVETRGVRFVNYHMARQKKPDVA